MTPDLFNGLFEFGGAVMIARSVLQLYRDKQVRGFHWWGPAFFACWGFWNLFYYPALGQWLSFAGGLCVVSVNTFWLGQIIYYRKKETT